MPSTHTCSSHPCPKRKQVSLLASGPHLILMCLSHPCPKSKQVSHSLPHPYPHPHPSTSNSHSHPSTVLNFNIQHSTFNIQHSTFNIQHSTFNIQHSTFNIRHSTLTLTHKCEDSLPQMLPNFPFLATKSKPFTLAPRVRVLSPHFYVTTPILCSLPHHKSKTGGLLTPTLLPCPQK